MPKDIVTRESTSIRRSALVTGALGGIGRAISQHLRTNNWTVIETDLHPQKGNGDYYIQQDLGRLVKSESSRSRFIAKVRKLAQGSALSLLVNNAAIQILGPTEKVNESDWETSLGVNLLAPFELSKALLPDLEENRGCIVNIGSIHANQTKPGFVVYATTKAAIVGLTKALAVDLGSRVRVNAICPAAISTPMLESGFVGKRSERRQLDRFHPAGQIGRPDEIARLVAFLASDAIPFLTGSCIGIDGAISSRLHDPV